MPTASQHRKGAIVTAIAASSGAPTGVLVRILQHVGPWTILVWRTFPYLITMAGVWAAVGAAARRSAVHRLRWDGRTIAACLFLAGQSIALVVAVLYTTVANVTCVQQLAPVFCAIGDKVAGDTLPPRTVAMVVVGLLGAGVLFGGEVDLEGSALGLSIALGNPLCWAFYWFLLRKRREHDATATAAGDTAGGAGDTGDDASGTGAGESGRGGCIAKSEVFVGEVAMDGGEEGEPDLILSRPGADSPALISAPVPSPAAEFEEDVDPALPAGGKNRERVANSVPYLVVAGLLCAVVGAAGGTDSHLDDSEQLDWLWYWLFGGLCLPVAQVLFTIAPSFIPTAEIACVKMVEVVIAPLLVFFYDGETPTWNTYVGGALIVSAVLGHSGAIMWEQRAAAVGTAVTNPVA